MSLNDEIISRLREAEFQLQHLNTETIKVNPRLPEHIAEDVRKAREALEKLPQFQGPVK